MLPPLRVLDHDVGAHDVRGHEVGRELDAREPEVEALRDRPDQERLPDPRHALEETVPLREDRDDRLAHHVRVADDHLPDFPLE